MKILFMSEPYMDLHLPIIEEMKRQGHEVTYVKDQHLSFDWRLPWIPKYLKPWIRIKSGINNSYVKYWENRIKIEPIFNSNYDIFFAINGCCIHPYLFKHLHNISNNLKSILYLWDNSTFYDYYHNACLFDRVVTFDYSDSKKYNAEFLPFYWVPDNDSCKTFQEKYLLSIIGSNHSGRLQICRQIYRSLNLSLGGGE